MAGHRQDQALRRIQGLGLVPRDFGSWPHLLATVALLPDNILASDLPEYPWHGLPGRQLPARLFGIEVINQLRAVGHGAAPLPQAAPPEQPARARAPSRPPPSRPSSAATSPQLRVTPQRAAYFGMVASVSPGAAVAALREARMAASTKDTYRAAELLCEASCVRGGLQPWPPSGDSLELFAGYLRKSGAFAAPGVYFWGIVE